ncbi:hypothetical protein GPL21_33385 [Bradyrhizobium pachyrhizi]|uniref:Uncharacterized protein n=1 Tax=Bradyrhizobium pachyrhizi TaxID=280333 RepID=A0A844T0U8_9BRAD|nr:hypothetical protein [Bradyrhizobium pachyrhizi]MVT69979.1 hypothetical protein [Bradyrhizobium pachyrhizi]
MTDLPDIDTLVRSLLVAADRLQAADQLLAGADAPAVRISLKAAAYAAGVSEAQMRKRCNERMYGEVAGGYGYRDGGRLEVVLVPFIADLRVGDLERVKIVNHALTRV